MTHVLDKEAGIANPVNLLTRVLCVVGASAHDKGLRLFAAVTIRVSMRWKKCGVGQPVRLSSVIMQHAF